MLFVYHLQENDIIFFMTHSVLILSLSNQMLRGTLAPPPMVCLAL